MILNETQCESVNETSTLNGTYFCFDIQNYRYGRKQNWETDSYSA